jgi:hypothetical protein
MTFSIEFTDEPVEYPDEEDRVPFGPGLLVMGETKEGILANLGEWNKKDYVSHWRRELQAIVEGSLKVALISSYCDPLQNLNMEIWPLYREGDLVRIQNRYLWCGTFPPGFKVSDLNDFIGDRVEVEDGHRLSEWVVTVQDIQEFLERSAGSS